MTGNVELTLEYTVTVHSEDGAFWAEVLELPGCFAVGDTMDELWESLTEAVSAYLSTPNSPTSVRMKDKEFVEHSDTVETKFLVAT